MPRQKQRENIILAAIEGFKSQKSRINQQIAELKSMLHGGNANAAAPSEGPGRKLSAAARRRIAQAQRERWSRVRGDAGASTDATSKSPKPKRRISPEGLKRIIAATKKRWALKRAEAARAQAAAAKRSRPVAKKGGARKAARSGPSARGKAVRRAPIKRVTKTAPAPAPASAQAAG